METAAPVVCECECVIDRLPEEILTEIISRTSPPAACYAAAVCREFRAAADSDAVWSGFLPRDFPRFAKGQLRHPPASKKGLFQRLTNQPALLPQKYMRMHLDKVTGAKCLTLSAAALQISYRDSWRLIHLHTGNRRFSEAVSFSAYTYLLEIRGKVQQRMLSWNTTYAAYMVFKLGSYEVAGWSEEELSSFEEASVTVTAGVGGGGGREAITQKQTVVLSTSIVPKPQQKRRSRSRSELVLEQLGLQIKPAAVSVGEDVVSPRERGDGWMEVELGEFRTDHEESEDGEVSVSLKHAKGEGTVKHGLVVWGIQIRAKQPKL